MRSLLIVLTCLLSLHCFSQNQITEAEYFIDDDPGYGNAIAIALTPATSVELDVDVPMNSLEGGIHVLHVRVKDEEDSWSLNARKQFYVYSINLDNEIVAAEYFIDEDPGVGNGIPLTIETGSELSSNFGIDLESLEPGIHIIHLRLKDDEDGWSLYTRKMFFILPLDESSEIVAAEYFIGNDPGLGNGTSFEIESGTQLSTVVEIDMDELEQGAHNMHVRVQNDEGKWSLFAQRLFYVLPSLDNEILAAEFFIDEDPGVGEGIPVAIEQGTSLEETLNIEVPDTLIDGDHFLHVRILDDEDKWSLYAVDSFVVDGVINVAELNTSFKIGPNPTTDKLFMKSDKEPILAVRVLALNGRLVMNAKPEHGYVNLEHLPNGVYLVKIYTEKSAISRRVVKQ